MSRYRLLWDALQIMTVLHAQRSMNSVGMLFHHQTGSMAQWQPRQFLIVCVTLMPSMLCRYQPGQRFGRHIDESVQLGRGLRTRYTLLIYLSGAFADGKSSSSSSHARRKPQLQGGATVFYGAPSASACMIRHFRP